MLGVHAQVDVASVEGVVLGVGDGDEEGEDAEDEDDQADCEEDFHGCTVLFGKYSAGWVLALHARSLAPLERTRGLRDDGKGWVRAANIEILKHKVRPLRSLRSCRNDINFVVGGDGVGASEICEQS